MSNPMTTGVQQPKRPVWDAAPVMPGLWVGSLAAAEDEAGLLNHRITHIITVAGRLHLSWREGNQRDPIPGSQLQIPDENILTIDVDDQPSENLLENFDECCMFITSALASPEKSAVLVHCASGISRSVAVCCAYLMLREKVPYDQALGKIRGQRPLAQPNFGFQRQLKILEDCQFDLSKAKALYHQTEAEQEATDAIRTKTY